MATANNKISTAQRMQNFAALTRQNIHELPAQTATSAYTSLQFVYPKARLLAKTYLRVEVACKIIHASSTSMSEKNVFDFTKIVRKITQDLNTGFMPIVMTGQEAALYNTIATTPDKTLGTNGLISHTALTATTTPGASNTYEFVLELKNTINDSQLQGLILLQNNTTQVTLNVDIGDVSDIINGQSGFTGTLTSVKITPIIYTYSVPNSDDAMPDISVVKLIQSKSVTYSAAGRNSFHIDVGYIYRKLAFYITDSSGDPLAETHFTGNFELTFNTADMPYGIQPASLRRINTDSFGRALPVGLYVFDFSSQSPLIGYGGNRDYIDTEKLTQFDFNITCDQAYKVTSIPEMLTRLIS